MRKVLKQTLAEADLVDVWIYTHDRWGEAQAERYFDELESGINRLTGGRVGAVLRRSCGSGRRFGVTVNVVTVTCEQSTAPSGQKIWALMLQLGARGALATLATAWLASTWQLWRLSLATLGRHIRGSCRISMAPIRTHAAQTGSGGQSTWGQSLAGGRR